MEVQSRQHQSPVNLELSALLPLRQLAVTLQFTRSTPVRFFHQVPLCAWLRYLLGGADGFSTYLRIDTVETGRLHYRAGDFYRFSIVCLAGGEPLLSILIHQLQLLPQSVKVLHKKLPFSDNLVLHSLQDAFTAEQVDDVSELSAYGKRQLRSEADLWADKRTLLIRWNSPARLLRDKSDRQELEGELRFCRDSEHLTLPLLLARLRDSMAELIRKRKVAVVPRKGIPDAALQHAHLFWIDQEYLDINGKEQCMGGLFGDITINVSALSEDWWQLLLLSQYTGVGQRTSFGWGRFQCVTEDNTLTYRRVYPAHSFLQRACKLENLLDAYAHVLANRPYAVGDEDTNEYDEHWGIEDEDTLPHADAATIDTLNRLSKQLTQGEYQPPPLRGVVIPKPDGGVRPLAIAPFWDAVLQRAICQALTPALDSLMYPGSHGYRKGKSRMTARYDIQRAWREGYRWVYESDIEDFFDSVNRQHLRSRLHALFGYDPLIELIQQWMAAPVEFENQRVDRAYGLPQGSPLSPLLANLMLDDFDSDMRAAGFRLVRFADDFVVMCKSAEEAQSAGDRAIRSLAEQGLTLNTEKTAIRATRDGFKYLGYRFINDLAIDISGTDKSAGITVNEKNTAQPDIPPGSWLARLAERTPQKISRIDALATRAADLLDTLRPITLEQEAENETIVVVAGDHSVVGTSLGKLTVYRKEKRIQQVPWETVRVVLLLGNHQLTTQAMHKALSMNIPVHLGNGSGRYRGVLFSGKPDIHGQLLWLQQLITASDEPASVTIARELVASRLRHMAETLRKRKLEPGDLRDTWLKHIRRHKTLSALNGVEGNATRYYFSQIKTLVPSQYQFSTRNRRPPKDPFNALLSLGYTVLYGITECIVRANGLLPTVGFYHQPHGRHATVASDLMEPFRHIVEQEAITLIRSSKMSLGEFEQQTGGGCRISSATRRAYTAALLARFQAKVQARSEHHSITILEHMDVQARSLKQSLLNDTTFRAWRMR